MTTVLGIWCVFACFSSLPAHIVARHLVVKEGDPQVFYTPTSVRITNAAFGNEISDASSRTTAKLIFKSPTCRLDFDGDGNDEEKEPKSDDAHGRTASTFLRSLTPGKVCSIKKKSSTTLLNEWCRLNKFLSTLFSTAMLASSLKPSGKGPNFIYQPENNG
jgi:hypothetical protein